MKRCRPKTLYLVSTYQSIVRVNRYGRLTKNFITTPSLNCAKRWVKKLKLKHRQIDVREKGKKPYVMKGSWI